MIPITDARERFIISLDQGDALAWRAFDDMVGGEIYAKKTPSMKVTDVARTIAPDVEGEIVGIRLGEKLQEQMIGADLQACIDANVDSIGKL